MPGRANHVHAVQSVPDALDRVLESHPATAPGLERYNQLAPMSFARAKLSLRWTCLAQPTAQSSRASHAGARRFRVVVCRSYATAQNDRVTTSSLLTSALDQKQRTSQRDDYVGPFQLGLTPPTPQSGENVKKWSQLSTAGKGASNHLSSCCLTRSCYVSGTYYSSHNQSGCHPSRRGSFYCSHLCLDLGAVFEKFGHCAVRTSLREDQSFSQGASNYANTERPMPS